MNQQTRTHIFISVLNAVPTGQDKAETADIIMDVAAAITGDKIDPRKELATLRADLAESKIVREELAGQNFNLRAQLARCEADNTALRTKMEALEAENTNLSEQLASLPYANALDSAIGKLENIGALTAEVEALKLKNSALELRVSQYESSPSECFRVCQLAKELKAEVARLREAVNGLLDISKEGEDRGDYCGLCYHAPPGHYENCKYQLALDKAQAALKGGE